MDTKGIIVLLAVIVLIAAGIAYFAAAPGPMPTSDAAPSEATASSEAPANPVSP